MTEPIASDALPGLVPRPPFQLRSLPIEFRWEVTRRHPYYQAWWKLAKRHLENVPLDCEPEHALRQLAVAVLGAIGVTGPFVDPATEFDELGADQLNAAWLSGAVQPVSLRGLAAILIAALPEKTAGQVGLLLCRAAVDDEEGEIPTQIQALQQLALLDWPGLDDYPDEPFVSVNPAASGRQVNEAVSSLLKQWKAERELPEKRDRSEKYADYLEVWDLREAWANGSYDRSLERTLKEIGQVRKSNLHTVRNHYCSAFQMITGREYSPELWSHVMGPLKLAELTEAAEARVSRRRPVKSPSRVASPETRLGGGHAKSGGWGVATGTSTAANGLALTELVADIFTLLAKGASNEEIVKQLDLSQKMLHAVEHLRSRDADGLTAQE